MSPTTAHAHRRIALVHNSSGCGPKRAIFEFARGLMAKGHTIDLFTFETANEQFLPLASLGIRARTYAWPTRTWAPRMRPFLLQQCADVGKMVGHIKDCDALYARIAGDIHRGGYDVAWVDNCGRFETPLILKHLRIPTVVYCHEPKREWFEIGLYEPAPRKIREPRILRRFYLGLCSRRDGVERWYLRRAAIRNMAHPTRVLTNSRHTSGYIRRAYRRNAQVSYLGADTARFSPLGLPREQAVVMVGHLYPFERVDLAIRAVAAIDPSRRPRLIMFTLTEMNAEGARLVQLARELGVAFEIRFSAPDAELLEWYNRAKAVLSTALNEPFGLVPLEAMACGTPVIAVREGGLQETVRDGVTGFLVEPTPQAFTAAIMRLLDDPDLVASMGQAGVELVRRDWTWSAAVERFERHVYEVAGGADA